MFFYYNALVINYSILDRIKALEILEDLKDNPKIKSNSYYHLFVHLNLAVLRFDVKEYKESIKNFTRLYMLDGYKTAYNVGGTTSQNSNNSGGYNVPPAGNSGYNVPR